MTKKYWQVKIVGVSLFLALSIPLSSVTAQEAVLTAGGNATGTGGSSSYSIGQMSYLSHSGTTDYVVEGVQQPYEISTVTAIEEAKDINLTFIAFPNPTSDYLSLEVRNTELTDLHFQMYDISGKLLQSEKITDNQTNINMNHLATSIYFVKIIQKNKEIKSFKIIKN